VPGRHDPVRLLNKSGTTGGRGNGYTDRLGRAMDAHEPEAVSREHQDALSDRAHRNAAQARQEQRLAMSGNRLDARIATAIATARHRRVDIHPELRLVRLAIQGGRSEAAISRRVDVIERKLWPDLPG
jgi:hypothetical protein